PTWSHLAIWMPVINYAAPGTKARDRASRRLPPDDLRAETAPAQVGRGKAAFSRRIFCLFAPLLCSPHGNRRVRRARRPDLLRQLSLHPLDRDERRLSLINLAPCMVRRILGGEHPPTCHCFAASNLKIRSYPVAPKANQRIRVPKEINNV